MKALFVTLLIFAAAFCAYDYYGAPVGQKMIFKSLNQVESAAAVVAPSDPATAKPGDAQSDKGVPKPSAAKAPAVADTPPTPVAPAPVANPTAMAQPKFDSLEVLTKGWTSIPKSAFPRQVHLKSALPFKMSVGSSTLNAGAEVTALGFDNGVLTLAPTAGASARAAAALDDTDLKYILSEGYEKWKGLRLEQLKKAHEQRLATKAGAVQDTPPAGDPSQAPARAGDGSYPLLVAHLNGGEVNEIKAKNVQHWGDPESIQFEGKPAWAVKIKFEAETVFGLQPADAQAVIAGGRVKGWFYTGSGEPVP